jgi:hypothetical protein
MALMKWREPNRAKWIGVRPAHNGGQILADGGANNTTFTIYTVPAGKTFHLASLHYRCYLTVAGESAYIEICNNVGTRLTYLAIDQTLVGLTPVGNRSFNPPIELLTGWTIKAYSSAWTAFAHGIIHGWEE